MNSTFIGLSTGVSFPHIIAFRYVINDFEVRGDKNHVDENVSEHGTSEAGTCLRFITYLFFSPFSVGHFVVQHNFVDGGISVVGNSPSGSNRCRGGLKNVNTGRLGRNWSGKSTKIFVKLKEPYKF